MSAVPSIRIVILGGGTAGWMAANLFAHHWGDGQASVTLVESPEVGIIGVGEGSTPQLRAFFQTLGIADADWMPRANATYKTGIRFNGWSDDPGFESYYHPFATEVDFKTQPQFVYNCRARGRGVMCLRTPTASSSRDCSPTNACRRCPGRVSPSMSAMAIISTRIWWGRC